jgi:ectoine hydroxylase-related dioxygenase (phytanoyl-CoA dioxygenase family)
LNIEAKEDRTVQVVKVERPVSLWRGAEVAVDPLEDIVRLGLEKNIAELDARGYTVVEPERAASPEFIRDLEAAILRVAEERSGVRPDTQTGDTHRNLPSAAGQHTYNLLLAGRAFEQAVTNEVALALVSYLLGKSCLISSMTAMVKGPGTIKLDLHSDTAPFPEPFPPYAVGCNATWAVTDYSRENGSVYFWPGSHKFCRQPTAAEREDVSSLEPINARAGSLIVWHGNTWHGACARTAPGLRVNLIMFFCRPFMQQQEWYRDRITPEILQRNGPRLAQLIGMDLPFPMTEEGPNRESFARLIAAARTQWG